jgi:hypothetical protein
MKLRPSQRIGESKVNLDLTIEQAEFLQTAMEWWKTSGVNFWSAQSAEEIINLIKEAK